MTDAKLKSYADRIERLMDERDGIGADIRDIFTEAKSAGYVPKVLRKAIARKRMDPSKRDEEDAILELYEDALDPKTRRAVKMAAEGATARQIEAETGIDQATVARSVSLKNRRETKSKDARQEGEGCGPGATPNEGPNSPPQPSDNTPIETGRDEIECKVDGGEPCPKTCAQQGFCVWDNSVEGRPDPIEPVDQPSSATGDAAILRQIPMSGACDEDLWAEVEAAQRKLAEMKAERGMA